MKVKYFPRVDENWNVIRQFAVAILYPDNYDPNKKYPCVLSAHGIGETGAGSLAMLTNLVEGFDYNGDGIREPNSSFVTGDTKKAIDQLGLVVVVPNYDGFFEPDKVNQIMDFVRTQISIVDEFMFQGFSLGGGAVVKYVTSNLTNANKVAYAVPCAPTYSVSNASIVGQANLPVHIFVNTNDNNGATNLNVTKNIVNAINASNPAIKAIYTAFNKSGHGGHSEAMVLEPPKAPNGQGFIDAAENVFQVYLDILKNGPRQMRSGTTSTTTTTTKPPVTTTSTTTTTTKAPTPTLTANAGDDQTVRLPVAFLDGTRSTGYKSAQWRMKQAPAGVSIWHPVVESGGWITTKLNFPKEGTYVITLKVFSGEGYTGTIAEDDIVINYTTTGTPPDKILLQKVFIPKTGKYVYVYDDGSVETKDQ